MNRNLFTRRTFYIYLGLLSFAVIFAIVMASNYSIPSGNVQVISITGPISSDGSSLFSAGTSSTDVIDQIDSAEKNPNVKAILLEINSPGGTVVGSAEIVEKIKSADKPVVAWIREIGTSGAYWAATASDAIVAHNLSITGSVGVTASYLEFSGLMDKYGIGYVNLSIPQDKEIGSQYRQLSPEERKIMDSILNETYDYFLKDAAAGRNMTVEQMRNVTKNGSVILGSEAYKLGLVDYLGGKDEAINVTKKLANLTTVKLIEGKKSISLADIVSSLKSDFSFESGFSLKA